MKIRKFKIQNLILSYGGLLEEHHAMMYRGAPYVYDKVRSYYRWASGDFVEFFTYFNSFTYSKWRKYTNIGNVYLQLRCMGRFKIRLFGHYRVGGEVGKDMYDEIYYNLPEMTDIKLYIPKDSNGEVIGFQFDVLKPPKNVSLDDEDEDELTEGTERNEAKTVKKKGADPDSADAELTEEDLDPSSYFMCIESGGWYTDVDEEHINDVRISIATTTFKNERYIKRNIDTLERDIFYGGEEIRDHIRMIVVDNGRTLVPEDLNSEYIRVIPNENVGGAGGFTRGMLEATDDKEFDPTHVLLMDDDVTMMPESFVRTYSLLTLLKPQYKDRFVSGAMLYFEKMNYQHEDVGFVNTDGSFGPNKKIMDMEIWKNVFENDEDIPFQKNSYAGWWYCCVPVQKIRRDHLPIPLFIRGDDVEFSLSNNAEFLTLNGICIWHKGFTSKFNANLELYMVHRNSLIIQAMSGICKEIDFIKRIDKCFVSNMCRLAYNNCELLLDSVEEFCRGPEFMFTPQGESIMKAHAVKNEVMVPTQYLYHKKIDFDSINETKKVYEYFEIEGKKKLQSQNIVKNIYTDEKEKTETKNKYRINIREDKLTDKEYAFYLKTFNGQKLSAWRLKRHLRNETAVIAYDWFDDPVKQYMAKDILAVNPYDKTAILRKRDKARFKALMKRRRKVMSYYRKNRLAIEQAYREAAVKLQSEGFWRDYLNMKGSEG